MKTKMMVATALGLFLTACSGGPSTGDVEEALQDATNAMAQQLGQFGVPAEEVRVAVRNRDCTEVDGGRAYDCHVEATVSDGRGNEQSITDRVRITEGSDGWRITH